MEKVAEQIALDFANGEYQDVFNALTSYSNLLKTARLGILVYKELEKMSQHVSVEPREFIEWLEEND